MTKIEKCGIINIESEKGENKMGARYTAGKYSKQRESEIRYNILAALQELATFNGIDINTIKETPPYSLALNGVTTQKMAAELKKLIDNGMVVKGTVRGRTVKYMLRQTYKDLIEDGKLSAREFGYGDYRDIPKVEEDDEAVSEAICERIRLCATRNKYEEMW